MYAVCNQKRSTSREKSNTIKAWKNTNTAAGRPHNRKDVTSVKKKMGQIGVVTLLLVLLTAFMGVMASAEEGGYWTEQLDEEGRVVRIFTYTEPVDITENEGEPMDDADYAVPEESAAEMVQVPVYLAGADAAPAPAAEQTTGITAGMVVVGMVTLAGLAFALYKAI